VPFVGSLNQNFCREVVVSFIPAERIHLIGCGGIGSWLLPPLLRFLDSKHFSGDIVLWDGDKYTESNRFRQSFAPECINGNKATVQMRANWNSFPELSLVARDSYVLLNNVLHVVHNNAWIIAAVDNHPCRALLDSQAKSVENVVIFYPGNELVDGNVYVHVRKDGQDLTPPISIAHPEVLKTTHGDRKSVGCEEMIDQGSSQLLITNFNAATATLNAFHAYWEHGVSYNRRRMQMLPREISFDIVTMAMEAIACS